jgi:deoxyribodipyrimidine photolyase-related protein
VEGCVQQLIGWREWIKIMYEFKYDQNFSDLNFFQAQNPLPEYFYYPDIIHQETLGHAPIQTPKLLQKDSDGLKSNFPLHQTLLKIHRLALAHHIEQLMILDNWMTLNAYHPKQCYDWFLSQFVDAQEWFMVPNVYGLGLFADGGIYATKPYISGGNYLKKMSDFPADEWEKIWTDKFWGFIAEHQDFFET